MKVEETLCEEKEKAKSKEEAMGVNRTKVHYRYIQKLTLRPFVL